MPGFRIGFDPFGQQQQSPFSSGVPGSMPGMPQIPMMQNRMGTQPTEATGNDDVLAKIGRFLSENALGLGGLGLAGYGAYKQGQSMDREYEDRQEDRRSRQEATARSLPFLQGIMSRAGY